MLKKSVSIMLMAIFVLSLISVAAVSADETQKIKGTVMSINVETGEMIVKDDAGEMKTLMSDPKAEGAVDLKMLKEDVQRLGHTVGDILDLSRIESNRLELDKVRIPLGRLVRRTVNSLQLQATEGQLDLNIETNGTKGFAECDPQKIERVILNIVRNAIKFTPPCGTIDVGFCTDPLDDQFFQVTVTDNGRPQHGRLRATTGDDQA